MVKTTDIRPVRERLAAIFDNNESDWRSLVGRLFGLRSKVVHGEQWEVPADSVKNVEALARVLLSSRLLGDVSDSLRAELLTTADLPS